jgi:peptide/nickel transport system substrate-binding protein
MRVRTAGGHFAVAVAVIALAAAGCGGSGNGSESGEPIADEAKAEGPSAGPDQEITVAAGAEPAGLDPQKEDDDGVSLTFHRVYEALYDFDVGGQLVPLLAEGMPKQVDDTTWEVKLKEGVKFSDGSDFTADDVKYSIDRITDPDYGSAFTQIGTVKKTEVVDDTTVRFTTKAPDPLLPNELKVARIVSEGAGEKKDWKNSNGTGPYKLASYEAGSRAVLEYNENYRGEKPQVTTVNLRFMPDATTRIQALEAGEVDLVAGISPDQASRAPKVAATAGPTVTGIVRLNTYEGPFADEKVRQAVNYAVDKEAINESLYGGYAEPSLCQVTLPSAANFNKSLQPYPHDPEKAKQLVEEAGATGEQVDISWSTGVFPQDRALGEAVAQAINDTGLKANMKFSEYNTWLKDIYATGADAPHGVWTESDDPLGDVSGQISFFYTTDGPVSTFDGSKNGMDDLYEQASTSMDEAERSELFGEIAQKGCDTAALLFLNARKDIIAMSDRMGYKPYAQTYSKLVYDDMSVSAAN